MGSVRVYITPMDADGNYTDEVEVTKYVKGDIGKIDIDTDSADYQLGVYRQSNVMLKLNNRSGLFSDVEVRVSMFRYTRADSKVRITWRIQEEPPYCGSVICGSVPLGTEIDLFNGLIDDSALVEDAKTEDVTFTLLGYETILNRAVVPFGSISVGDTLKQVLYTILNQSAITDYLTVDEDNINPAVNGTLDAIDDLENQTVREAVDALLQTGNCVLYITDNTIHVEPRTAGASVAATFYGQASQIGAENIIDIKKINSGKHRLFNYISWEDSSLAVQDSDSVALRGVKKKELGFSYYTDSTKRQNILQSILDEFKDPKKEMELTTVITYSHLALNLLDRISIDYPTVFVAWPGSDVPICGVAICGEAVLPRGLWAFFVPSSDRYKILKKTIDTNKEEITFKLRKI